MRVAVFLCLSVLAWSLLGTVAGADEHFPFLGEVAGTDVNVRAGGSTNYERVDQLKNGEDIVILEKKFGWYRIVPRAGAKAYIRADYLALKEKDLAEVTGSAVNVRAAPSSGASVMGRVSHGDIVRVVGLEKDFRRVEPPAGTSVWVKESFVKLKSAVVPPERLHPARLVIVEQKAAPSTGKTRIVSARGTLEVIKAGYGLMRNGVLIYRLPDVPSPNVFLGAVVDVEGRSSGSPDEHGIESLSVSSIRLVL